MIPVLITGFNRPELLRKTLENVLSIEGLSKLYVHIDGPRLNNKQDLIDISECISIINSTYSEITINTKTQIINLGCDKGMKHAIDWFFQNENYGVIIEDDVYIHKQSLQLCELALVKYQKDFRVGSISLYNPIAESNYEDVIGFFSMYPMLWGWATWKDRWELNTGVVPENFKKILDYNKVSKKIGKIAFRSWKKKIMNFSPHSNTWDIPLILSFWENNFVAFSFPFNLAYNYGVGDKATHTKSQSLIRVTQIYDSEINLDQEFFPPIVISSLKHDKKVAKQIWDLSFTLLLSNKIKRTIKNLTSKLIQDPYRSKSL